MLPLNEVRLVLLVDDPCRVRPPRVPRRPTRPLPVLPRPAVLSVSPLVVVPATDMPLALILAQKPYVIRGSPRVRAVLGHEMDLLTRYSCNCSNPFFGFGPLGRAGPRRGLAYTILNANTVAFSNPVHSFVGFCSRDNACAGIQNCNLCQDGSFLDLQNLEFPDQFVQSSFGHVSSANQELAILVFNNLFSLETMLECRTLPWYQ